MLDSPSPQPRSHHGYVAGLYILTADKDAVEAGGLRANAGNRKTSFRAYLLLRAQRRPDGINNRATQARLGMRAVIDKNPFEYAHLIGRQPYSPSFVHGLEHTVGQNAQSAIERAYFFCATAQDRVAVDTDSAKRHGNHTFLMRRNKAGLTMEGFPVETSA